MYLQFRKNFLKGLFQFHMQYNVYVDPPPPRGYPIASHPLALRHVALPPGCMSAFQRMSPHHMAAQSLLRQQEPSTWQNQDRLVTCKTVQRLGPKLDLNNVALSHVLIVYQLRNLQEQRSP